MRRPDGIADSADTSSSKLREMVKDREAWRATVHGVSKSRTDWVTQTTTRHLPSLEMWSSSFTEGKKDL